MLKSDNYKVYRIYNLDMKTGKYDVKVFDNKEIQDLFKFVPVSYRVEFKWKSLVIFGGDILEYYQDSTVAKI